jgi:hypothetical protein
LTSFEKDYTGLFVIPLIFSLQKAYKALNLEVHLKTHKILISYVTENTTFLHRLKILKTVTIFSFREEFFWKLTSIVLGWTMESVESVPSMAMGFEECNKCAVKERAQKKQECHKVF